jgi:hypothetical protein
MSSYSLTSAKKEQFMDRSGSFSTHGSRRGFVDIDLPIHESQMHSLEDEREEIAGRKLKISLKISENRKLLGIRKGKQLRVYEEKARQGKYLGSRDLSRLLLLTIGLAEQVTALEEKLKEMRVKKKEGTPIPRVYFITAAKLLLPKHLFESIWLEAQSLAEKSNV